MAERYYSLAEVQQMMAEAEQRGRDIEHRRLTNHDRHSGLACLSNYQYGMEQGQRDEREKHHKDRCCSICDTHVMPHRGCILR